MAQNRNIKAFFDLVLSLEDHADCAKVLSDLFTASELNSLADRWAIVKLLDQGLTYREISKKSGVSTATVTRVAKALYNGQGGYSMMLDRLVGPRE